MRNLLIFLTFLMGLGSVNVYAQKSTGNSEIKDQPVKELIESKRYVINCDRIYPQRLPSKFISNGYSVEMKGDTVRSYLPYVGVAQSANYGGSNVLDFEEICHDYQCTEGKKDRMIVTFKVKNENETFVYKLTVYSNGKANVRIQPMQRDAVSFSGELDMEQK